MLKSVTYNVVCATSEENQLDDIFQSREVTGLNWHNHEIEYSAGQSTGRVNTVCFLQSVEDVPKWNYRSRFLEYVSTLFLTLSRRRLRRAAHIPRQVVLPTEWVSAELQWNRHTSNTEKMSLVVKMRLPQIRGKKLPHSGGPLWTVSNTIKVLYVWKVRGTFFKAILCLYWSFFLQNLLIHNRLRGIYASIRMVLVSCSCLQPQEKYKMEEVQKKIAARLDAGDAVKDTAERFMVWKEIISVCMRSNMINKMSICRIKCLVLHTFPYGESNFPRTFQTYCSRERSARPISKVRTKDEETCSTEIP